VAAPAQTFFTTANVNSGVASTMGGTPAAGGTVVACLCAPGGGAIASISSTIGTFTKAVAIGGGVALDAEIWVCTNASGTGADITPTVTGGAGTYKVALMEWAGKWTVDQVRSRNDPAAASLGVNLPSVGGGVVITMGNAANGAPSCAGYTIGNSGNWTPASGADCGYLWTARPAEQVPTWAYTAGNANVVGITLVPPIQFVQSSKNPDLGATPNLGYLRAVTPGNTVLLTWHGQAGTQQSITSITDNQGNTWTNVWASGAGGYNYQQTELWRADNVVGGDLIPTVNYTGGNYLVDGQGIFMAEFAGLGSSDGAVNYTSGTSTTFTATTRVASQAGDLAVIVGQLGLHNDITSALPATPWTSDEGPRAKEGTQAGVPTNPDPISWQVLPSTAAASGSWTGVSSVAYSCAAQLFAPKAVTAPSVSAQRGRSGGPAIEWMTATINPNGASTAVSFDYGPTAGYGTNTGTIATVTGWNPVVVSVPVAGLSGTYHFRAVATNSAGTTNGSDATFPTVDVPRRFGAIGLSSIGAQVTGGGAISTSSAVTVVAGVATVTAAAYAPTVGSRVITTPAAVTAVAPSPTVSALTAAGLANVTVAAYGMVPVVVTQAGSAAAVVAAYAATAVIVGAPVVVVAGVAQVVAAALAPTVSASTSAGLATATAAALAPSVAKSVTAGLGTASASALAPTVTTKITAGLSQVTGAAYGAGPSVATQAGAAAVTGAALAPAAASTVTAPTAAASAAAQAPTSKVTATPPVTTAAAVAYPMAPSAVATAGRAQVTASALSPTTSVVISAGIAMVAVAAYVPTVSATGAPITVTAGVAQVTAQALAPTVGITQTAGSAAVSVAAYGVTTKVTAGAGLSQVTVQALGPSPGIRATAGAATVTGAAWAATGKITAIPPVANVAAVAYPLASGSVIRASLAQVQASALAPTITAAGLAGIGEAVAVAFAPTVRVWNPQTHAGSVSLTTRMAYGLALTARQAWDVLIGTPRIVAPFAVELARPSVGIESRQVYRVDITAKGPGGDMVDAVVEGNLVDLFATFTDEEAGTPAEPTTVTFTWTASGEKSGSATYAGAIVPDVDVLWHVAPVLTAVGQYAYRLDTTDLVGTVEYAFHGSGSVQAVGTGSLVVLPDLSDVETDGV
jgi:hypothetical protein